FSGPDLRAVGGHPSAPPHRKIVSVDAPSSSVTGKMPPRLPADGPWQVDYRFQFGPQIEKH
ncbi:MAG TPA: hypothetical protein VMW69_13900, partial [Spirochaetia bacterium]|nr:hypothetical protein [Spirochaetia bacterium]